MQPLSVNKFKKLNIDASEILKNYFYSRKIIESSSNIIRKMINFGKVRINNKILEISYKNPMKNKIHLSKIKLSHQEERFPKIKNKKFLQTPNII